MVIIILYIWLVVSTNPSEKYEFVNWDYDIPYGQNMFQTTNQGSVAGCTVTDTKI
jgi:hypothetical protein